MKNETRWRFFFSIFARWVCMRMFVCVCFPLFGILSNHMKGHELFVIVTKCDAEEKHDRNLCAQTYRSDTCRHTHIVCYNGQLDSLQLQKNSGVREKESILCAPLEAIIFKCKHITDETSIKGMSKQMRLCVCTHRNLYATDCIFMDIIDVLLQTVRTQ